MTESSNHVASSDLRQLVSDHFLGSARVLVQASEATDPRIPTIPFEGLHKPPRAFRDRVSRAFDLLCPASIGRMMELEVSGLAHDEDADGSLSPLSMMRSPFQCPRTARSCASRDRSEIITTSAAPPRTGALRRPARPGRETERRSNELAGNTGVRAVARAAEGLCISSITVAFLQSYRNRSPETRNNPARARPSPGSGGRHWQAWLVWDALAPGGHVVRRPDRFAFSFAVCLHLPSDRRGRPADTACNVAQGLTP